MVGVRDRSWGIRPVGQQPTEAFGRAMANAWLWAPIHFEHECRSLGYFQKPGGEIWRGDGFRLPGRRSRHRDHRPGRAERYHPSASD